MRIRFMALGLIIFIYLCVGMAVAEETPYANDADILLFQAVALQYYQPGPIFIGDPSGWPESDRKQMDHAYKLWKMCKEERAMKIWNKVSARHKDFSPARLYAGLAGVYLAEKENRKGIRNYERAYELRMAYGRDNASSVDIGALSLFRIGRIHLTQYRIKQTREYYREVIRQFPESVFARDAKESLENQCIFTTDMDGYLPDDPDTASKMNRAFNIYAMPAFKDDARGTWKAWTAESGLPTPAAWYFRRGMFWYENRKPVVARRMFKCAYQLAAEDYEVQYVPPGCTDIPSLYYSRKPWPAYESPEVFYAALSKGMIGYCYLREGKMEEAIEWFKDVLIEPAFRYSMASAVLGEFWRINPE